MIRVELECLLWIVLTTCLGLSVATYDFVYKPDAWTGALVVVVNADTDPGAIKSPKLKKNKFVLFSFRKI